MLMQVRASSVGRGETPVISCFVSEDLIFSFHECPVFYWVMVSQLGVRLCSTELCRDARSGRGSRRKL